MKCPKCGGKGKTTEYDGLRKFWCDYKCEVCNGTGEVEQTEQEYLQTCDTAQLIRFLLWYPYNVHGYPKPKMSIAEEEDAIREWLKRPHK